MRTKKELDKWLRQQWTDKTGPIAKNKRIGLSVPEIVAYSAKRNAAQETPILELWIAILDEFISWENSILAIIFPTKPPTNFHKSIFTSFMKIVGDSMAMRHLIVNGFDISARTLLRSIGEYIEVVIAILDNPALADEFVKTDNPKEANRFWWSHLAKGKIANKMSAAYQRKFKSRSELTELAGEISTWPNLNDDKLSSMIHPSIAGGIFTGIPFKETYLDDSWLAAWGEKAEGSVHTVCIYAEKIFPLLFLFGDFPFYDTTDDTSGFEKYTRGIVKYDHSNELHRHVMFGSLILGRLIITLLLLSDGDAEHFPKFDLSIWK